MDKGKRPAGPSGEVPWSEKYRPRTLDEVAAHSDIIDTSEHRVVAVGARSPRCRSTHPPLPTYAPVSQKAAGGRQPASSALLWPTWHWKDQHNPGHRAPNIWDGHGQHDVGAQCLRRVHCGWIGGSMQLPVMGLPCGCNCLAAAAELALLLFAVRMR